MVTKKFGIYNELITELQRDTSVPTLKRRAKVSTTLTFFSNDQTLSYI